MPLEKQPSARLLTDISDALEPALRRAGAAILAVYHRAEHGIQTKPDLSPVTDADIASHHILIEALQQLTPDWPVVSEEDSTTHHAGRNALAQLGDATQPYWLLDPLDGTKEFIARTGEFSVNLGLVVHHQAYFGILYGPMTHGLYRGGIGIAAEKKSIQDKGDGPWVRITCRTRPVDGGVLITSRRSTSQPEGLAFARHDFLGSALKFGRIAEGSADYYLRRGSTMEWDTCAGQAIIEAAGGRVTTLQGDRLAYGKPDFLNLGFIAQGR